MRYSKTLRAFTALAALLLTLGRATAQQTTAFTYQGQLFVTGARTPTAPTR